jgi:phosphatidylserine decarboxylase
MAVSRYPLIAREGWLAVLVTATGAAVTAHYLGWYWSAPLWVAALCLAYLFRDPEREIPPVPLAVVSPCDGTVAAVESTHDPYLARDAIRITIRMSRTGVFTTRSPVEGKVLEPANVVTSGDTMPHGVWLKTDEGDDIVIVMHRGPLGNAPRCYVQFGERVGQGQRCGFIHLGSRVDLYLPPNSKIKVTVGDQVAAGADVLATLVHKG